MTEPAANEVGVMRGNLPWQARALWVCFSFWTIARGNHSSFIDAKAFFTVINMGYANEAADILFLGFSFR